jgi:hypothetical protein
MRAASIALGPLSPCLTTKIDRFPCDGRGAGSPARASLKGRVMRQAPEIMVTAHLMRLLRNLPPGFLHREISGVWLQ